MKFHFWNAFFLVFFLVLAMFAYLFVSGQERLTTVVSHFDFVLMILATQRLVRLFAYDHVTEFFRNWFTGRDSRTFLGTLGALLNCPWCTGLWFALVVVFGYYVTPVAWYAILVLALSSIASIMQVFVNYIGWSAELKKKIAQES